MARYNIHFNTGIAVGLIAGELPFSSDLQEWGDDWNATDGVREIWRA